MNMVNLIQQTNKHMSLRECGGLAKIASKYKSSIVVMNNKNSANAKSMLNVVQLCINANQTLLININGEDEQFAYNDIKKFLREL